MGFNIFHHKGSSQNDESFPVTTPGLRSGRIPESFYGEVGVQLADLRNLGQLQTRSLPVSWIFWKISSFQWLPFMLQPWGHVKSVFRDSFSPSQTLKRCVVKRSDWHQLRESFTIAFRRQRAAYRRANGGTTAPALVEDVEAHWASRWADGNGCLAVLRPILFHHVPTKKIQTYPSNIPNG